MNEKFKLEIVTPEKNFLSEDNIYEVVIPAYEGEMGILKDHISIISFLKPGIIKINFLSGKKENYFIEEGLIEFKENCLSILTSKIFDIKKINKLQLDQFISQSEKELSDKSINDNKRFLINQKIDTLKSINLN